VFRSLNLRSRVALIGSLVLAVLVCGATLSVTAAGPAPSGQAVIAWHVTISADKGFY
jgi:hypothetical protein